MQVLHSRYSYTQDPIRYFHFEDYAWECGDFVLISGGFAKPHYWDEYDVTPEKLREIKSKKIVRLEFAEPSNYFVHDISSIHDKDFYKIFTICPYTAAYLNRKYGTHKRVPIFFPISERYIPAKRKKTIDILYSGHIVSRELKDELKQLKSFHYALISNSNDSLVTHRSASYKEKMKLYSQSKITLVHNVIFKTYPHRVVNIWLSGDYWNNEAFKQIPSPWRPWELWTKNYYVPQLKSRAFEAAISRSLILCRKDDFGVIERYFKPHKEFVYYEKGKLQETVRYILAHYAEYTKIIERAYYRAIKDYTVQAFVKKYLMNMDNE